MNYEDYKKEIEFKRQEADRYGKLAEYYREQGERVKRFGAFVICVLVVIMLAAVLLSPKPRAGQPLPGGEQFPIQDPGR
jgi:hypothetical protein